MFLLPTAAPTLAATLLLITTITALPHPQPQSADSLATRQIKYDQFDDFWANWLKQQDRTLGTGGKPGDKKVKRSQHQNQNWDRNQVHFKKHGDVYADLLEARLKRLGTED